MRSRFADKGTGLGEGEGLGQDLGNREGLLEEGVKQEETRRKNRSFWGGTSGVISESSWTPPSGLYCQEWIRITRLVREEQPVCGAMTGYFSGSRPLSSLTLLHLPKEDTQDKGDSDGGGEAGEVKGLLLRPQSPPLSLEGRTFSPSNPASLQSPPGHPLVTTLLLLSLHPHLVCALLHTLVQAV
ncbi:hypothetical protein Cadr_000003276 [Camelus dromedarius]|uniref:Uncharacterized protein n=1 Tax=Camelus dromedarius TaxID=9838 RepID=A0A5N4C2Z7_CAMDR|nr:hypothetical protein Cadr_000003276 [Camelus dromedarius]